MIKRESTVERYLVNRVQKLGGMAIKLNPIGMAGLPDRLVLLPDAKIIFAEVKRPGGQPRKLQTVIHNRLRKLGFRVEVVDNNDRVKEILKA
jgi:hypothetical protein